MEKQKVFIPVESFADADGRYNSKNGIGDCSVKEQEGYFFTLEQMEEIIRDAYVAGFDDAPNEWKCEKYIIQSLNIK